MDDNARPHRARIVEEYLEDHGLERMEWPARSPDLNPIEHLWDYLGREVAALNPPPRSLHELKQGLLCVWSSLPIPVSDNLINSMGNRCRQCIQRWWNPGLGRISLGGHTDLHVFHGGTVTGLRYRDEILDPYVRPYAAAIGNDFILMDDNARPHRARIVEEYLEDHGLERMEWPARSPDLNPIEHL
ncbi:uncharacterized protein TNCV_3850931 [Trichonephila clavipes]|nr:uncharacterized protein TNCV_3850931 [Trichonephila clavipes]